MKRFFIVFICLCLLVVVNSCNNIGDGNSEQNLLNEEYLNIEKIMSISDGKPEYKFTMKLTEDFKEDGIDEFTGFYGVAEIVVYEIGKTDKLIDTIVIEKVYPECIWDFNIIDVNFDGHKDIVVVVMTSGNQNMHTYNFFTWNEELSKYEKAPTPEFGFVGIDPVREQMLTSWRIWAGGHGWAIYEYIDGVLTMTHECSSEEIYSDEDESYSTFFNEKQLINGEMQTIFDDYVTDEELDEHLLYDEMTFGVWAVIIG